MLFLLRVRLCRKGRPTIAASLCPFSGLRWLRLLSPILSRLTGKKIPDVVFLLIFGLLIGPNMLNLASSEGGIPLLKELGLGMLF